MSLYLHMFYTCEIFHAFCNAYLIYVFARLLYACCKKHALNAQKTYVLHTFSEPCVKHAWHFLLCIPIDNCCTKGGKSRLNLCCFNEILRVVAYSKVVLKAYNYRHCA